MILLGLALLFSGFLVAGLLLTVLGIVLAVPRLLRNRAAAPTPRAAA
jgi:hypothetical protein